MFHKKIIKHSKEILQKAKDTLLSTPQKEEYNTQKHLQSYLNQGEKKQVVVAEISFISALKVIGIIFILFLGFQFILEVSDILISFFVAVFLSTALYPSVHFFEKKGIHSALSIFIVFSLVIIFFGVLVSSILPALIDQGVAIGNWAINHMQAIFRGDFSLLPSFVQQFGPLMQDSIKGLDDYLKTLGSSQEAQQGLFQLLSENISRFVSLQGNITDIISGFFSFLIDFILVLVLTFFILFEREQIFSFICRFFSVSLQNYVVEKSIAMQNKISQWVHGQMILFIVMGSITWFVLWILGVPYAMTIGFFAGLAEFIPFVGPLLTAILAVPLAFGQGWEVGVAVIIFLGIMQFVEGNVFIPIIMKQAVGVSALTTILAMLIGFHFLGIMGAIMSIPLASIIGLFLEDFQDEEE